MFMTVFMRTTRLTSLDLIKTLAIFLMLIDHLGFYLWQDNLWLRAIGRACVPIWFFLIGYGRSGKVFDPTLAMGGLLLVLANGVVGLSIFPINILASMMLARAVVPRLMLWLSAHKDLFWPVIALLVLMAAPTNLFFEYGTLGWLLAMFGWQLRAQHNQTHTTLLPNYFLAFVVVVFVALAQTIYNFSVAQLVLCGMGTAASLTYLCWRWHTPQETAWLNQLKAKNWAIKTYQYCGRHSLQIYVGHLLVLKFLALILGQIGFTWFDWHWF
jgi:surface polysaccharide O-acyltransferase-like enzyme